MTKGYNPALIAQKLHSASLEIDYVVAASKKKYGIQGFYFVTKRLMTTDEMVSICQDMATVIRRDIPERPDGWAAAICPGNAPGRPMGAYYVGWAGRPDEWDLNESEERKATDHADWLAFRDRLQATVAAIGTEGERAGKGGDFKLCEVENGPREQTLFINNSEFLTTELIVAIQNMLRDGPADRVVTIFPAFGKPFETLWEGLEVRSDSVVERWDREEAEQLLGDRLKIPRYVQGDS